MQGQLAELLHIYGKSMKSVTVHFVHGSRCTMNWARTAHFGASSLGSQDCLGLSRWKCVKTPCGRTGEQ